MKKSTDSIWWNNMDMGNGGTWENIMPQRHFFTTNLIWNFWCWTRVCAVSNQQLAAWGKTRPFVNTKHIRKIMLLSHRQQGRT